MASPSPRETRAMIAGVLVVRGGLHDGLGPPGRVAALEDARAHEHALGAQLHHERGVGRSGDAAGREVDHRELAVLGHPGDQFVRGLQVLGGAVELVLAQDGQRAHLAHDGAHVPHRLDDVAGAGLALGADHGRALGDAPQRLAQVDGAAHERDREVPLVDVVGLVGRGEHFALVDVVDLESLEDLGLDEVADAGFRHDRDGDRLLDLDDLLGIGHAGHAAVFADVGRHALEGHDGAGAGVLGDLGLLGVGDVHDDPALEHLGEARLDSECSCVFHRRSLRGWLAFRKL